MPTVLFLDDDEDRHARFEPSGWKVARAHTYEEAANALQQTQFDTVCLDFDLNDHDYRSFIDTSKGLVMATGLDVAKVITKMKQRPKLTVVHSMNLQGGADDTYDWLVRHRVNAVKAPFYEKEFWGLFTL